MRHCLKNAIVFIIAVAGIFATALPSSAHHLWVMENDGGYAVCRGSVGKRLDTYNPLCVTRISAIATNGTKLKVNRKNEKELVSLTMDEKPAIIAVTSEWGDRVNTTRGKKLMDRQAAEAAGLTVINAFTSTQFSKTLFAPSEIKNQSLGLKFELVPVSESRDIMPGTPLSFKLLFDGKPLTGVTVFTDNDGESKSNESGIAKFTFEKSGVHLLYAIHKVPAEKSSGLDFYKFMTFLTFEVK